MSVVTKRDFCALRCRSMFWCEHRSIFLPQYLLMVELDGHLGCLLQIFPKWSKMITYLQIILDLINIINRLYNIIISYKNTYKPWVKVGQISGLSAMRTLSIHTTDFGFIVGSIPTSGSIWARNLIRSFNPCDTSPRKEKYCYSIWQSKSTKRASSWCEELALHQQ